jgi:septum formation protein
LSAFFKGAPTFAQERLKMFHPLNRLMAMTPLVLASTSPYRRELLQRLGLPFTVQKPLFDEDSAKHTFLEARPQPKELCRFLGCEKARSLSTLENCVIGGDQILVLGSQIFGKPGTTEKACAQLSHMQGKTHELLTSVTVFFHGQAGKSNNTSRSISL